MTVVFTYPFYPSTNINKLSKLTYIDYEFKTHNDMRYLEFYFDILGMIRSDIYRTTVITGLICSPDNMLGKLLTGLGFNFDTGEQHLSYEYTNNILRALHSYKGNSYLAKVHKLDNTFPKYVVEIDTLVPYAYPV